MSVHYLNTSIRCDCLGWLLRLTIDIWLLGAISLNGGHEVCPTIYAMLLDARPGWAIALERIGKLLATTVNVFTALRLYCILHALINFKDAIATVGRQLAQLLIPMVIIALGRLAGHLSLLDVGLPRPILQD